MTLDAGRAASIPVGMCGEMAGDVRYTRLLLGLGLRQFSVHPSSLLELKQVINSTNVEQAQRSASAVLGTRDPDEFKQLIAELI